MCAGMRSGLTCEWRCHLCSRKTRVRYRKGYRIEEPCPPFGCCVCAINAWFTCENYPYSMSVARALELLHAPPGGEWAGRVLHGTCGWSDPTATFYPVSCRRSDYCKMIICGAVSVSLLGVRLLRFPPGSDLRKI